MLYAAVFKMVDVTALMNLNGFYGILPCTLLTLGSPAATCQRTVFCQRHSVPAHASAPLRPARTWIPRTEGVDPASAPGASLYC